MAHPDEHRVVGGQHKAVVRGVLRHVGRGTLLTPSDPTASDGSDHPSPGEIMISRLTLEPELLPQPEEAAMRTLGVEALAAQARTSQGDCDR